MILADEEHDNTVASNIFLLQQEEYSHLDKLLKILLELQVLALLVLEPKVHPELS
jgi:hypothetical protein